MDRCFAYDKKGCKALSKRKCENCSFYKTKEEARESRIKAIQRILSLDSELRDYIIKTYYGDMLEV